MSSSNSEMGRIEASWNELNEQVNRLGPGGLVARGSDGWAVKDHLTHVAAWEHSLLALIEGRDRQAAMGLPESSNDIDAINEAIRTLHHEETPQESLKYFWETHARLVAALGKLSDADLQKPYANYQPGEPHETRPVANWVAGNTYEHYAEHVGWIKESSAER